MNGSQVASWGRVGTTNGGNVASWGRGGGGLVSAIAELVGGALSALAGLSGLSGLVGEDS